MIRNHFTADCLEIFIERKSDDQRMVVCISSDFSGYCHKQQLHVNEKQLATDLEDLWKSIKTKKLMRMNAHFTEIDHYDDMTDIYTTPRVSIERGLKRARISEREHGSIPKDWTFNLIAVVADTATSTPIVEVLKKTLCSLYTKEVEKKFLKALRPLLQKKQTYAKYYCED
jgi:hypothetical protein